MLRLWCHSFSLFQSAWCAECVAVTPPHPLCCSLQLFQKVAFIPPSDLHQIRPLRPVRFFMPIWSAGKWDEETERDFQEKKTLLWWCKSQSEGFQRVCLTWIRFHFQLQISKVDHPQSCLALSTWSVCVSRILSCFYLVGNPKYTQMPPLTRFTLSYF